MILGAGEPYAGGCTGGGKLCEDNRKAEVQGPLYNRCGRADGIQPGRIPFEEMVCLEQETIKSTVVPVNVDVTAALFIPSFRSRRSVISPYIRRDRRTEITTDLTEDKDAGKHRCIRDMKKGC